jgi:hypothetical protein
MSVATGPRSAFEQAVLARQKELAKASGNKNRIIQPKEIESLAAEFFGNLKAPDGAEIISQSPLEVVYKTADGKQYRQFRNLSGSLGADVGRVETKLIGSPIAGQSALGEQDLGVQLSEQIKRLNELYSSQAESLARGEKPAGLDSGTSNYLNRLDEIIGQLTSSPQLATLDPETQASLDAINAATQAKLDKQFSTQGDDLVGRLFGRGVNQSSIAADQAGRLMGEQGLVRTQALSDAAQRQLAVRQFLAQLGQQNLALGAQSLLEGASTNLEDFATTQGLADSRTTRSQALLSDILNQLLQREVSGAQLEQSDRKLSIDELLGREQGLLNRDIFEQQDRQLRRANNPFSKILSGVLSAGLGFATSGGFKGLFGGSKGSSSSGINNGLGGGE